MPFNNFSVGKDVSLVIFGTNGVQTFPLVTQFDYKQETQQVKIVGIDGVMRPLELPVGWSGSFEIERQDSGLDDYIAQLESNYYNGQNIQGATITETISEPNGATTQYRFEGVALKLEDGGTWKGDATVKQKLAFVASRRRKVL